MAEKKYVVTNEFTTRETFYMIATSQAQAVEDAKRVQIIGDAASSDLIKDVWRVALFVDPKRDREEADHD